MAPHYYLTIELNMDSAISARAAINSDPNVKISYNDMVVKASAMALRKHPKVNSHWTDTSTLIAKHIHIGVAVAVDDGLLVPVLINHHLLLPQLQYEYVLRLTLRYLSSEN